MKAWEQMTFGEKFKQYRKHCGYTQRELANLLGVHFTYISKIENGATDYHPSDEFLTNAETHLFLDKGSLFEMSGRIDASKLQALARNSTTVCSVLRRIATGCVTGYQYSRIMDILDKDED